MTYEELAQRAIDAKAFSYSPYSQFRVGAALLTQSGKVYTGCNVESVAYGPSNCAERTAVFKAVSEGERYFTALAVVGSRMGEAPDYCYPCGVCRQVLAEFVSYDTFEIIVAKSKQDYRVYTFRQLLPWAFGPEVLKASSSSKSDEKPV